MSIRRGRSLATRVANVASNVYARVITETDLALYKVTLGYELERLGLKVVRSRQHSRHFLEIVQSIMIDMIVDDLILVDIIAVDNLAETDLRRMRSFLKMTGYHAGLVINYKMGHFQTGVVALV